MLIANVKSMTPKNAGRIVSGAPARSYPVESSRARSSRRMYRRVGLGVIGLALGLVLAGCGSGTEGAPTTSNAGGAPTSSSADDTPKASSVEVAPKSSSGTSEAAKEPAGASGVVAPGVAGTGMIEIGDLRYELNVSRCTPMFGMMGGSAESVTEPANAEVDFELPPTAWSKDKAIELMGHAGMVRLWIEDPYTKWTAGDPILEDMNLPGGIKASDAVVTELRVSEDGRTMEGKANFVDIGMGTNPELRTGTFHFSCPPAG